MVDVHVQDAVREQYGRVARSVRRTGCCGPSACGCGDPITSNLYPATDPDGLPAEVMATSFGCGNPTALTTLEPGQTVLDLGSGGGIDVLLSAKRVGPTGKVYGLDMTDEMLELARENQRKAAVTNAEFLKGTMEAIPLPDESIDVIISNCVINLSVDKDQVLREAFRVLKPGGRLAVSDVVWLGEVPPEVRLSRELWIACLAGALQDHEYMSKLKTACFVDIEVDPWRIYTFDESRGVFAGSSLNPDRIASEIDGRVASAFIRARKPAPTCCGTECCSK